MSPVGDLLPVGVGAAEAIALVLFSVATSALTAAVGIGGGVLMLVAMAFVVPIAALIPVHGVVQLGSNAGRTLVLARSAELRLLIPFLLAALVGAFAGALIVTDLPERVLLLVIGGFVIFTTWAKLPALGRGELPAVLTGGFAATLLTMFVGATGPFVTALFRQAGLPHKRLVATTGAAMVAQHALKVAAFAALGFAFQPWLPLIAAMVGAGFLGTLLGTRLLDSLPEATLKTALKWVLTVTGAQLLVRALLLF